jgi:hypothetical protein
MAQQRQQMSCQTIALNEPNYVQQIFDDSFQSSAADSMGLACFQMLPMISGSPKVSPKRWCR